MNRYSKAPKYTVGTIIVSPDQVIAARDAGMWIWFGTDRHARVYHAAWIANMNFACVMSYIASKQLAFAIRNPEYPYTFKAKFMESHVPEKCSEWWATCSELPDVRISAFTRDAVVLHAEDAVRHRVSNPTARVHVTFEQPEIETAKAKKELMP